MIDIVVKIDPPLSKLSKAFGNVDIKGFLRGEITKVAFLVERYAKQVTPVATGILRGSIGVSSMIYKLGAIVQTNVKYAIFVHEGTRFMRARPFMEHGVKFAKRSLDKEIGGRLDKHLRKKLSSL